MDFNTGKTYTRADIFDLLDISPAPTGGNWFTGYHIHKDEVYVFANVGVA